MSSSCSGRKVLILADLEHASPRIPGMAKYLGQHGWTPVVLAPRVSVGYMRNFGPDSGFFSGGVRVEQVGEPYASRPSGDAVETLGTRLSRVNPLLFSMLRWGYFQYRSVASFPDGHKAWIGPALDAARHLLEKEPFSLLLSSSSPVTMHVVAAELKRRHGLRWVADLRDLWTQNHNYVHNPVRRWFERRLEIKTLTKADALTTVSGPLRDLLLRLHGPKPCSVITNGYDPENYGPGDQEDALSRQFSIAYTGSIYLGKQNPALFLAALKDLLDSGSIPKGVTCVDFYGPVYGWLNRLIEEFDLLGVVNQHGMIGARASWDVQRRAQLLLVFDWESAGDAGVRPTKVFEYLGARRPIIVVGGVNRNGLSRIVDGTGAGVHCLTLDDAKKALLGAFQEYCTNGCVVYRGDHARTSFFAYPNMAKRFSQTFDAVTMGVRLPSELEVEGPVPQR